MKVRRVVGFFSIFFVIFIAFNVYGPWDLIGATNNIKLVDNNVVDGEACQVTGDIYHKEIKNDKPVLYLKNATIKTNQKIIYNSKIILYPDSDVYPINSTISSSGTINTFDVARNFGNFDVKTYYNSLGLSCAVTANKTDFVRQNIGALADRLYLLKNKIVCIYEMYLPGEEAGFLASITLGDKSALDGELKELFNYVGLAHILAVSGLHVSVICLGLYSFLKKRGMSFVFSSFSAGTISVLYMILTGCSISSIRAVGMFLIFLLSQLLGENYDLLTALMVVADILLIKNPLYIKNSSFIFSFSAIVSIALVAKPISARFDNYFDIKKTELLLKRNNRNNSITRMAYRCLHDIIGSLVFSIIMALATLPVVAFYYYEVPTYNMLLNFILLPLMPILLFLGLIGGIAGVVVPTLSFPFLRMCHYIIYLFELVSDAFTRLPMARVVIGQPKILIIFIYYLILILIASGYPTQRVSIHIISFVMAIFILISPIKTGTEIDILDVGQGDGTFIRDEGASYFIDGGSTDVSEVGKYRIIPFLKAKGVGHIDYWFISHFDTDHVAGLIEAIENDYKIDNIVISPYAAINDNYNKIMTLCENKNINIVFMEKGDYISSEKITLTCLYPWSSSEAEDLNESCLVLLLSYTKGDNSFTGFFGGDIGKEQEKEIVEKYKIKNIDLLKVSHHGSKNSSDESFIKTLMPKLSTVSCALVNSYGHPAQETIDTLNNVNSSIFYTMYDGQISVKLRGDKYEVQKYIH